ncbi:hypothetical protein HMPREF9946_02190 [Acetobacteraceae bacterium AT-5844]|nr:hypothetical protein HMPREF9946_02190 [Acetobacteraceae bacterium AT-5844]
MPVLSCYVDENTLAELHATSAETGRTVEDLAEGAIASAAAMAAFARRRGDPAERAATRARAAALRARLAMEKSA